MFIYIYIYSILFIIPHKIMNITNSWKTKTIQFLLEMHFSASNKKWMENCRLLFGWTSFQGKESVR